MEQARNRKAVLFGKALAVFAAVAFALCLSAAYPQSQAHAADGDTQAMHRLYNPNSGEHFYTASTAERDYLMKEGWNYEDVAWTAPVKSNTPVYRLYNSNEPLGDHHYTTSKSEYDYLVSIGWTGENIGWYSDDAKGVALLRLYNPNAYPSGKTGAHHYTANQGEHDNLVGLGWQDEKIGWYGVDTTKKDEPAVEQFTVKFVDADGKEISSAKYDKGTKASAVKVPADPTKAADATNTYVFAGWDPEVADVTKDATYKATFTAVPKADVKTDSGVAAAGGIFDNKPAGAASLELVVEPASDADKAEAAETYATEIGANEVKGVYEVDLLQHNTDGTTKELTEGVGALKLTFPVEAEDGTAAKVIQLHENGSNTPEVITHDDLTVADRKVEVTLQQGKLSTFIVTTETEAAGTYTLELDEDIANGKATLTRSTFDIGDTIKVMLDPEEGYQAVSVTLADVYNDDHEFEIADDGRSAELDTSDIASYLFDEDEPVIISVTFKLIPEPVVTYNAVVDSVTGGAFTLTKGGYDEGEYAENDIVNFSFTPETGKALIASGIKILKADGTDSGVTASVYDGGHGTFKMPAYDVKLQVTFTTATYLVQVLTADNGTVTASPTSAVADATVTLTIAPETGYELDTLTVATTTEPTATVETTKVNDTTYTFTMPADMVAVTPMFKASATANKGTLTLTASMQSGSSTRETALGSGDSFPFAVQIGDPAPTKQSASGSAVALAESDAANITMQWQMKGPDDSDYVDIAGVTGHAQWKPGLEGYYAGSIKGYVELADGYYYRAQSSVFSKAGAYGFRCKVTWAEEGYTTLVTYSPVWTINVNQVYDITKASATNGQFDVKVDDSAVEKAPADATVTIVPEPSTGYEVDTVKYTPSGESAVTVTADETTKAYTFTMPAKAVEVSVTFKATGGGAATSHTATVTASQYLRYAQLVNRSSTSESYVSGRQGDTQLTASIPAGTEVRIQSNDNNMEVTGATVTGSSSGSITVSKDTSNSFDEYYWFTMPDEDVSIVVTIDEGSYY